MNYHCLIVDDNEDSRIMLSEIIALCGHSFAEAKNAKEALSIYKNQAFDYVFVDWMMPQMDGIDLIKEMRKVKAAHPPKIIMCTAKSKQDAPLRLREIHIDDYLQKPTRSPDIRAILGQTSTQMLQQQLRAQW
jgi:CheY-like chemotaxis protein